MGDPDFGLADTDPDGARRLFGSSALLPPAAPHDAGYARSTLTGQQNSISPLDSAPVRVWSVGHSNHDFADFLALLAAHHIEAVADIRRFPMSRKHPQFHIDALSAALAEHGLVYRHLPELGGRRTPRKGSPNDGWKHRSFRGYADHALTGEFTAGFSALRRLARTARTAMMCSESLWWRCHRRLVADRLVAAGDIVLHVFPDTSSAAHELTPFAGRNADGTIVYSAEDPPDPGGQRASRS